MVATRDKRFNTVLLEIDISGGGLPRGQVVDDDDEHWIHLLIADDVDAAGPSMPPLLSIDEEIRLSDSQGNES